MNTYSPEAQKAKEDAAVRYHEQQRLLDKMRAGPYFDAERGELRIPAYFWNARISPLAAAEWRKRGMAFDKDALEWYYSMDETQAAVQVPKARSVFDRLWQIRRDAPATTGAPKSETYAAYIARMIGELTATVQPAQGGVA